MPSDFAIGLFWIGFGIIVIAIVVILAIKWKRLLKGEDLSMVEKDRNPTSEEHSEELTGQGEGPPESPEPTEAYDMQRYTLGSVLRRIRAGKTSDLDAEQVEMWVVGDRRGEIVKAYLRLTCSSSDARRFISQDLREALAAELMKEGYDEEEQEIDMVERWARIEHRKKIFTALSVLDTYMADVIQFVTRDIRMDLADRLVRPDR